jgi:hypothetical protein
MLESRLNVKSIPAATLRFYIVQIDLFLSLLGLQAQIGPICSRALCNILTFALP